MRGGMFRRSLAWTTTTAKTTSHTCVALQCGMQAFAAIVSIALLLRLLLPAGLFVDDRA